MKNNDSTLNKSKTSEISAATKGVGFFYRDNIFVTGPFNGPTSLSDKLELERQNKQREQEEAERRKAAQQKSLGPSKFGL